MAGARVDRLDTLIAFLVATISIVSAVVAGRAAVWSSTASDIDSAVFQEAIEARQLEGDLDVAAASDLRLAARYDAAAQRVQALDEAAAERWADDPLAAERLDLAAQAEWEVALALWRFFRAQLPAFDDAGQLVFDVDDAVAAQRAADPRLTELVSSRTADRAAEARGRTIALVAIAVLFVAALFILTLAEVWPGRGRWAPVLIGAALAALAAAATVATDPDTAILVVAIALIALVSLVAAIGVPDLRRRRSDRARAVATAGDGRTDDDTPTDAQPPVEGDDPGQTRGRTRTAVVVALAAATLLGASVAYLQSAASDRGAAATLEAQAQALLALTEHQRAGSRASADLEVWSLVEEHRARAAGARQLARYLDTIDDAAGAAEATADAERWDHAATEADALTVLADDHPDGPSADAAFPTRFLARQGEARAQRIARQDLANEASASWGARGAAYVAVLATLAIAAYLLGLSLILRRVGLRRLFAVVGGGLVVAAAVAGAATALEPVATPDRVELDAITGAFARGRIAAEGARSHAERTAAVAAYREAVDRHPTFARGHVELASALFDESSPQTTGYLSVATIDAVEAALSELETAERLGWDDLATRGDVGFYRMLVGLARPETDLTALAVDDTASALELGPDLPVLRFNHAAALLADGRVDEARLAYDRAIAATMALDAGGGPRFSEGERSGLVAGAITDLELIDDARSTDPAIPDAVADLKAAIVVGTGDPPRSGPSTSSVTVSDLALHADPALLWWDGRIEGWEPGVDSLSVLWLMEDPAVPGWHVLPGHSGPLRLGERTAAGELYEDGAAPAYWSSQSYLLTSDPHRCVPDGRYRLELYVNGRLAAEPIETTLDTADVVTEARPDLGLMFCRPTDWAKADDVAGDTVSFVRPDGTTAMLVTRVHRPDPPGDEGVGEVLAVLDAVAAAWPGAPARLAGVEPVDAYLMGLRHAKVMWYEGPGGSLKVIGGATDLGTVVAVALAGTSDWVDGDEAAQLIGSFLLP